MFRLFVSHTSPRRPRSATPAVESLEKILTLSSVSVDVSNLGNALVQKIDQDQSQKVDVNFHADNTASAWGEESNAANFSYNSVSVDTGDQSQYAANLAYQDSYTSINGGIGG